MTGPRASGDFEKEPQRNVFPCLCERDYPVMTRDGLSWCTHCGLSVWLKLEQKRRERLELEALHKMAEDVVIDYMNNRIPKGLSSLLPVRVALDEVIVVKLTKIRANWTALVRTTLEDNFDFEVIFDANTDSFIVRVYRDFNQMVLQKAELFPGE